MYPDIKTFLSLAKEHSRIVVSNEIVADRLTPVGIFEALSGEMREGALLESGMHKEEVGRHSFLAFDPMAELRTYNKEAIYVLQKKLTAVVPDTLKKISANAVGFLAYDGVRHFEKIPDRHPHSDLPDFFVRFYRTTLMFDHQQQKLTITSLIDVENDAEKAYRNAEAHLEKLIQKIKTPIKTDQHRERTCAGETAVETDLSDAHYQKTVERAKAYIQQGDIFQVVLSRCFTKKYSATPFDVYRALRRVNPSPYMFYLPIEKTVIAGASPERMVQVKDGIVSVNPIAGTRPRNPTQDDAAVEKSLLNDPKELAEHMMLVDLARNDIGAVSEPGSVKVTELLRVKHFSHVSHLTSLVAGKLRKNIDPLDALAAAFPAGTLSGAPKIRAMEIIDELETSRRGIYGGAIFRLDEAGNLDSCIAIRMAVLRDGIATVRAGSGIVYDSDPQTEADENRHKAKAMLAAIALADRGLS